MAQGQVDNGIVAINNALGAHDAAIWNALQWTQDIALSGEATAISTATAVLTTYHNGDDVVLEDVFIGLAAQSSSGDVTVDVKKNGSTIFSTKPSAAASQDTNLTGGTLAVLSGTVTLTQGDKLTFNIDAAGTGAKGLKIYLSGRRSVD